MKDSIKHIRLPQNAFNYVYSYKYKYNNIYLALSNNRNYYKVEQHQKTHKHIKVCFVWLLSITLFKELAPL